MIWFDTLLLTDCANINLIVTQHDQLSAKTECNWGLFRSYILQCELRWPNLLSIDCAAFQAYEAKTSQCDELAGRRTYTLARYVSTGLTLNKQS